MALVVIALAGCYLLSRLDLSVIVVVGLFLQLFSGNWSLMGIPLPLDRVVLAVALIVLVLKGARWVCARRLVLRPLHVAMLCAATWAVASGHHRRHSRRPPRLLLAAGPVRARALCHVHPGAVDLWDR